MVWLIWDVLMGKVVVSGFPYRNTFISKSSFFICHVLNSSPTLLFYKRKSEVGINTAAELFAGHRTGDSSLSDCFC